MSFVTGLLLIDAPASALNNLGQIPGARTDNTVGVKVIKARDGAYPYVSAQAFRYWLRTTLQNGNFGWKAAPIFREEKVAYTDANPIEWWDDDLFGYMRAPSTKASAQKQREQDESRAMETPTRDTVTRASPFRVSTLVSIAPVTITDDFGVMARHEGDPVPHEHQFYRTTLKGLFSLDLRASGTFWYRNKTGFRNLDEERKQRAEAKGLEHLEKEKAYRLPLDERVQRVAALFEGLAQLEGGAKQTLHYTDVSPVVTIMAVTRGGNHIFGHVVGATTRGLPEMRVEALEEVLTVFADDIVSPVYVGWVRGYMDEERTKLEAFADTPKGRAIRVMHPREAFGALVDDLRRPENHGWLD
ncbi:MAG: type I-B CRISPR-associated protein Cas7/Cst2/DevR [Bacillota bacterium]|nr:type I-B CRISPR-associated protein Cas7/Cst2/DevR [Bacillota bacterium]